MEKLRAELQKERIPFDTYQKIMRLAADFDFDGSGEAAANFKAAIVLLNEKAALPSHFSSWCGFYGIDHQEMDLEPMDEILEF